MPSERMRVAVRALCSMRERCSYPKCRRMPRAPDYPPCASYADVREREANAVLAALDALPDSPAVVEAAAKIIDPKGWQPAEEEATAYATMRNRSIEMHRRQALERTRAALDAARLARAKEERDG